MKKRLLYFFDKYDYAAVIAVWIIFQIIWTIVFGFNFKEESVKYIDEADFFSTHHSFSQQRYLFYSITIFIIAFSNFLKLGLNGAVLMIMLLNLGCYLYFFKALKHLFTNKWAAFAVLFFLMFFWPYQRWSVTLFTECAFYSFAVLLLARLILFTQLDLKFIISTSLILFLLLLSRPLGVLFIIPLLVFIYFQLHGKQKLFFFLGVIVLGLVINQIMQIVFTTTADWDIRKSILEENLICDMPTTTQVKQLDFSDSHNQMYQLLYYITHNFSHFFKLAIGRLQLFFLLRRDYYSAFHNAYLLSIIGSIYVIIIARFNSIRKSMPKGIFFFMLSSVLLFTTAVAFQCDDYHSRFFMTLMPVFALLAVTGFSYKSGAPRNTFH